MLADAVAHANVITVDDVPVRVIRVLDLLHEKLRSGSDPARRRSKRIQDLADAAALIETDPNLASELTESEKKVLDRLPE